MDNKKITIRLIYKGFEIDDNKYLFANKFEKNNNINVLVRIHTMQSEDIKESNILEEKKVVKKSCFETYINDQENETLKEDFNNMENETLFQEKPFYNCKQEQIISLKQSNLNFEKLKTVERKDLNTNLHRANSSQLHENKMKFQNDQNINSVDKQKSY